MPDMLMGDDENAGMPPRVTDEQIAEWERLAGAATAGPWTYDDGNVFSGPIADARHDAIIAKMKTWKTGKKVGPSTPVDPRELVTQCPQENPDVSANEAFIASAREAVPALVAALREARALLAKARHYVDLECDGDAIRSCRRGECAHAPLLAKIDAALGSDR